MGSVKKIVLTGPESSGKSWLCEKLARHFEAPWVPEYARIYLEKHGPEYDFALLKDIAVQHKKFQEEYLEQAGHLLFLDTDMINYHVWQKLVFDRVHPELKEMMAEENDHLYLITYPDIPWEPDPLRENPHGRDLIFEAHKREIAIKQRPYRIIKGHGEQRLANAISAVEELLNTD